MADELPAPVVAGHQSLVKERTKSKAGIFDQILSEKDSFLPWETVQLPSKGVYYTNVPDGKIQVRPMGVDVDKMMSNQRLVASGDLLNKIVESCVKFPDGFTVYDMLAGDQQFLLYYLRGITHGPLYEFTTPCPHCGNRGIYEYDLTELYKTVKGPHPDHTVEPMEVMLPRLSGLVKSKFDINDDVYAMVRLVRVMDILTMTKKMNGEVTDDGTFDPVKTSRARNRGSIKEKPTNKNVENQYLDSMKLQIVGFRIGVETLQDTRRISLMSMLSQNDSSIISDFINKITPGIETAIEVTCQNVECAKDYTIALPFGENFFRSNKP